MLTETSAASAGGPPKTASVLLKQQQTSAMCITRVIAYFTAKHVPESTIKNDEFIPFVLICLQVGGTA